MGKFKQNTKTLKNNRSLRLLSEEGFTIIETLIALVFFSLIITLCLLTFIYIGELHQKSLNERRVQDVVHQVAASVTESIQTSGVDVHPLECSAIAGSSLSGIYTPAEKVTPCEKVKAHATDGRAHWQGYCIGGIGYLFRPGVQVKNASTDKVFVLSFTCNPADNATNNLSASGTEPNVELSHRSMRVVEFNIAPFDDDVDLYRLLLKVALGGDDSNAQIDQGIFNYDSRGLIESCKTDQPYCTVVDLDTTVFRQLR